MTNLPAGHTQRVTDFLKKVSTARGRIAFVIDATGSREQSWDYAAQLQAEMFSEAAKLGGLELQVICFRGFDKVEASNWTADARELQSWMGRIRCETGHTKYARAFARVRQEHQQQPINAVIAIGDDLEEQPQELYDAVGGLGVPCFCFQEGDNPILREAFREMVRLTKGAYYAFNPNAIAQLRELLRAVAAFAVGGLTALADQRTDAARKLLGQLK
jgi:ribosomal protein S11